MAITILQAPRHDFSWSKNEVLIKLETDEDPTMVRIQLAIFPFKAGASLSPVLLEEVPDSDGLAIWDISGILDELFGDDFNVPTPDDSGISAVVNSPLEFNLSYTEIIDGVSSFGVLINDEENEGNKYRCLKGGVSSEFIDKFNDICEMFFSTENANYERPFLTWQPKKLLVDKNQSCPLYFLNIALFDFLFIDIHVYAGATEIIGSPVAFVFGDAETNLLYLFNAGWKNLSIDSMIAGDPLEDDVTHYTVQLMNADFDPVSELRTFYLDELPRKESTYIAFQNSLNGFDDVRFIGEAVTKVDYDRSVSAMTGVAEVKPQEGVRKTFNVIEQFGKKVSTGYLSPKECNALRESLLSIRMFEFIDGVRSLGIEWSEKSKELLKSSESLHGVPLEFIYTTKNQVFTSNPDER